MTQYEFGYKLARLGLIVLFTLKLIYIYILFFIVSRDVINAETDFTSKFYSQMPRMVIYVRSLQYIGK